MSTRGKPLMRLYSSWLVLSLALCLCLYYSQHGLSLLQWPDGYGSLSTIPNSERLLTEHGVTSTITENDVPRRHDLLSITSTAERLYKEHGYTLTVLKTSVVVDTGTVAAVQQDASKGDVLFLKTSTVPSPKTFEQTFLYSQLASEWQPHELSMSLYYLVCALRPNVLDLVLLARLEAMQNMVSHLEFQHMVLCTRLSYAWDYSPLRPPSFRQPSRRFRRKIMHLNDPYGPSRHNVRMCAGGLKEYKYGWCGADLKRYATSQVVSSDFYRFIDHLHAESPCPLIENTIHAHLPLDYLCSKLAVKDLYVICERHNIFYNRHHVKRDLLLRLISEHKCTGCASQVSVFQKVLRSQHKDRQQKYRASHLNQDKENDLARYHARKTDPDYQTKRNDAQKRVYQDKLFPPQPASQGLKSQIIGDWVRDTSFPSVEEAGCSVCGALCPLKDLKSLKKLDIDLDILNIAKTTRKERFNSQDKIEDLEGPVLTGDRDSVCFNCAKTLSKNHVPPLALANGMWLGEVPEPLKDLTWMEQRIIARVIYNNCVAWVYTGAQKMRANAISHAIPVPKVYDVLPPTKKECEELLAIMFISPFAPKDSECKRTPFVIRRNRVREALEWLKLNHVDYADIEISERNLAEYKEDTIPVSVIYQKAEEDSNKVPEATAVNDSNTEDGTTEGTCPFVINTLTVDQYNALLDPTVEPHPTKLFVIARALDHFNNGGKVLGVGHAEDPERMYDNPQLYPRMFPHLFPYGYGGFGNDQMQIPCSEKAHKKHLLMYHDKRFQRDASFCLVAFNHEQRKNSAVGGHILAKRSDMHAVAERILGLNSDVLQDLIRRMQTEHVKPVTEAEKQCFRVLSDIDYVNTHVQGSITGKKDMRGEIWSLTNYLGAPSWFITFAPDDIDYPLALYYAGTEQTYYPDILDKNIRTNLIAKNPVAGARFFKVMVELFLKHVLGVDADHPGVYGDTEGYYGTVEQQGRLTLHLHLLLWIKHSLTPQEIRDKVLDPNSDFQKRIVEYLESVRKGECTEGTLAEVDAKIKERYEKDPSHKAPVMTMPKMPVEPCKANCEKCDQCMRSQKWWKEFIEEVDEIVFKSNTHICSAKNCEIFVQVGKRKVKACKARMPRQVFKTTLIDANSGAINQRKGEGYMNWYNPVMTYLLRCNTDVTSLLSGTAMKSVIAYTTDYITKPGLKTHTIFQAVKDTFSRSHDLLTDDTLDLQAKGRKVILKVVNALTGKSEIGAPMAAMYLLDHPDHYTSHKFRRFYWRSFAKYIDSTWRTTTSDLGAETKEDSVLLWKKRDSMQIYGVSNVDDYTHRPKQCASMPLYDWVRLATKQKIPKSVLKKLKDESEYMVDTIAEHRWRKNHVQFLVEWSGGDKTWESYTTCSHLQALDHYLAEQGVNAWRELSKKTVIESADSEEELLCDSDEEEDFFAKDSWEPTDSDTDSDIEGDIDDENNNILNMSLDTSSNQKDSASAKIPSGVYFFDNTHPQHATHRIKVKKEKDSLIPDFRPLTLPRKDKGNYEDYCMTMLMFFKPWHKGQDLKEQYDTWAEAFEAYTFSSRQKQLMQYFHLRYECLDARDDYSAQRKAGNLGNMDIPFTIDQEAEDGAEDASWYQDQSMEDDEYAQIQQMITEYSEINAGTRTMLNRMNQADRMLQNSGALDPPDIEMSHGVQHVQQGGETSSAEWKDMLIQARKKILEERKAQSLKSGAVNNSGLPVNHEVDSVKIIDKDTFSYVSKDFQPADAHDLELIDACVADFTLNTEQERAFRIIANHSTDRGHDPLKMYLGGMAGTGKSQVINALTAYFGRRVEDYRLVRVAPTGSAAALIDGSTYHSMLGMNQFDSEVDEISESAAVEVNANLRNVDYLFMDEVSMLDCLSLYRISNRMCKARQSNLPFGGISVIFAGDFAQLAPVNGFPLYHCDIDSVVHTTYSLNKQQAAIGKALWHQFTVVVILKQNMRQKLQTPEDTKLRTCLEHMRYQACDKKDKAFLRSLLVGRAKDKHRMADPNFHNVSIITHFNGPRDQINDRRSEQFARETGQSLHTFYSRDTWRSVDETQIKYKSQRRSTKNPDRSTNAVPADMRQMMWNLPAGRTEHVPGMLQVCLGMPVMIKKNIATECAVTNGAEGVVVGWKSRAIDKDHDGLDVLFVKLTSSPKTIRLPGLEENVVPIAAVSNSIEAKMASGIKRRMNRVQVPVVLNYAMTDYSAQGRTRPFNVCDLSGCQTCQSVYTCLSRSSTFGGTMIMDGLQNAKISGGISGYLRQEFRELELLDEITRLRYQGSLPPQVVGDTRRFLIHTYRTWKGKHYVPPSVPEPLRWSQSNPFDLDDLAKEADWITLDDLKKLNKGKKSTPETCRDGSLKPVATKQARFITAQGSQSLTAVNTKPLEKKTRKRKNPGQQDQVVSTEKRAKNSVSAPPRADRKIILGLTWNMDAYSCAYDSLFTILKVVYDQYTIAQKQYLKEVNPFLGAFCSGIDRVECGAHTFEWCRDEVRQLLHQDDPEEFPLFGAAGTDIYSLCRTVLKHTLLKSIWICYCSVCKESLTPTRPADPVIYLKRDLLPTSLGRSRFTTTATSVWFKYVLRSDSHNNCGTCYIPMKHRLLPENIPKFLLVSLQLDDSLKVKWEHQAQFNHATYQLCGLVYYGHNHFTCRIICKDGTVWYHDGIRTKNQCVYEGHIETMGTRKLATVQNRRCLLAIYHYTS